MSSAILVHPDFDASWPFSADHFHELWREDGHVEFVRVPHGDKRCASEILAKPQSITRLVACNVPGTENCLAALSKLREAVLPFFFSSRRRHTRLTCDWSSDVCSSD